MAAVIHKARSKKSNNVFALVAHTNGAYSVFKLCENYSGHCAGGLSKTWRYLNNAYRVSFDVAKSVYGKRLGASWAKSAKGAN